MVSSWKLDLATVRRVILARRGPGQKVGLTLAAILLPALLRWAIDRGHSGFPFATFYPFVVLSAVLLDWRFASIVAIGAGLFSAYVFPRLDFPGLPLANRALIGGVYLVASATLVAIGSVLRNALAELQTASDSQAIRAQELVHRFKNLVAVVNALALQTVRNSPPESFHPVLSGRLDALVKATELAMMDHSPCDIGTLVASALAPFQNEGRIRIQGSPALLAGKAVTALVLALHELATNAVKYGALARPDGSITIVWTPASGEPGFELVWLERGGPPVSPPAALGFGSRLLDTMPEAIAITRHFEPDGLRCEIRIRQ